MSKIQLNISPNRQEEFVQFKSLSKELKDKLFVYLKSYKGNIIPEQLINYLKENLLELEEEQATMIANMYLSLIDAKNNLDLTLPHFLETLQRSLQKINATMFGDMRDFEELLKSAESLADKAKVVDLMTKHRSVFVEAETIEDIRPLFDNKGTILGSAIIHQLKISLKEDNEIKETYLALDSNDVEKLIEVLTLSKSKVEWITQAFNQAKFINLK